METIEVTVHCRGCAKRGYGRPHLLLSVRDLPFSPNEISSRVSNWAFGIEILETPAPQSGGARTAMDRLYTACCFRN